MPPNLASTATLVAGSLCAVLGLGVMLGWHLQLPAVIQILPSFVPMQYNTALAFLLGGAGLLGARAGRWPLTVASGLAVALLGLLTLASHAAVLDLGLDELFMRHYITVATSQPGRMAPNTALCFSLGGAALALAGLRRRSAGSAAAVCLLAALVMGLSFSALLGYLVGIPTAYGWGSLTRMALHTALGFLVLGLGLIALCGRSDDSSQHWQPWAIGVLVSTTSITLWQALSVAANDFGRASHFVLAFGLLMALALSLAVAYALKLRRAGRATKIALEQLGREIVERQKAEDQVRQLAFYDMLTRLPNRLLLNERLQHAMAASKRHGHFGAAMFLDLDNFKPLNDTHGHAVGDLLLVQAAERLLQCVRETDTVARFGGDEFVVVLGELSLQRDASVEQALHVAEKILAALSAPYRLLSKDHAGDYRTVEHHCTASIGMALFHAHLAERDDILKWADAAMYQAKEAGRNAIRLYAPAPAAPA